MEKKHKISSVFIFYSFFCIIKLLPKKKPAVFRILSHLPEYNGKNCPGGKPLAAGEKGIFRRLEGTAARVEMAGSAGNIRFGNNARMPVQGVFGFSAHRNEHFKKTLV